MNATTTDPLPARDWRAFRAGVEATLASLGVTEHFDDETIDQLYAGRADAFVDSRHYFEAHITLEPREGGTFDQFRKAFQNDLWRVSQFAEDDVDDIVGKWFITSRAKDQVRMTRMVQSMCQALTANGFTVLRAKIEDTILDTKYGDEI